MVASESGDKSLWTRWEEEFVEDELKHQNRVYENVVAPQ
jgi:hypothetical protein